MFERRKRAQLTELGRDLSFLKGELTEVTEKLQLVDEYQAVKKELTDKEIELDKLREKHEREAREIEHKLGLHKTQVEQERVAAVAEAKLAVREEALEAQKGQFQTEMKFMQDRFEKEVESQRKLVEQVLERLPKFERTYSTVEHIGREPGSRHQLEITDGE